MKLIRITDTAFELQCKRLKICLIFKDLNKQLDINTDLYDLVIFTNNSAEFDFVRSNYISNAGEFEFKGVFVYGVKNVGVNSLNYLIYVDSVSIGFIGDVDDVDKIDSSIFDSGVDVLIVPLFDLDVQKVKSVDDFAEKSGAKEVIYYLSQTIQDFSIQDFLSKALEGIKFTFSLDFDSDSLKNLETINKSYLMVYV